MFVPSKAASFDSTSISMFTNHTGKTRCACWTMYYAAQQLWDKGFPRAYLRYYWDSGYPVDHGMVSEEDSAAFEDRFPNSTAWMMSKEDNDACQFFSEWGHDVATKGLSLLLYGGKGCGKSALATSLALEATKRNLDPTGWRDSWKPYWLSCDHLYEIIQQRGPVVRETMAAVEKASLLVVDDLRWVATGFAAADLVERLHRILQVRTQSLLPTIITANRIGECGDLQPNAVTAFLGISDTIPVRYGHYRMISLTNDPLRPNAAWSIL
jgi:hypothetical protein